MDNFHKMFKRIEKIVEELKQKIMNNESIIEYAIDRGYLSFYPPSGSYTSVKEKPWEKGVKSEGYTEEEKRQIEKEREEMEARGERVWY